MGIEQMLYHDMAMRGEGVLIGNTEALKQFGIYLKPDRYMLDCKTSNNHRKRHGLPMYRKTHLTRLAYHDVNRKLR